MSCLTLHMKAFHLCGIIHPLNAHPLISFLHRSIFIIPIAVHLVLTLALNVTFNNPAEVLTINVACSLTSNLVKYFVYATNAPEVRRLVTEMTELSRGDEHCRVTHARCEKNARLLLAGFYFCCVASSVLYVADNVLGTGTQQELPLKAWYPFDTEQHFKVALVMQALVLAGCSACVPVLDTFLPALLLHSSGQLDELARALHEIGRRGGHARAEPSDTEVESTTELEDDDQVTETRAFHSRRRVRFVVINRGAFGGLGTSEETEEEEEEKEAYRKLLVCVRWHQRILSLVRDVSNLFSPIIFVQLLSNSVVICLVTFQIAQHAHVDSVLLGEVLYLGVALMQIGFFCYFGSELLAKGTGLCTAGYHTRWHVRSLRFKKTLRMLMLRAQQPLVMVGGRFYEMTLQTFVAMCKASVSYFSVLRQVASDV